MVRNGLYAFYGGREYAAARTADGGGIKLIYAGDNPPDGFVATPYGNYVKTVEKTDVSELFIVKSYAVIGGERLEIASADGGTLTVATSDEETAKRLHMKKADRHDYRMQVGAGDAEDIVETRRKAR